LVKSWYKIVEPVLGAPIIKIGACFIADEPVFFMKYKFKGLKKKVNTLKILLYRLLRKTKNVFRVPPY